MDDEFSNVARARESWQAFTEAMTAGREILRRAGVPDPPPIPEFDMVFRRLNAQSKNELYAALREALRDKEILSPADAIKIWQPLIKKAFSDTRH
jgi:hypothetical protein